MLKYGVQRKPSNTSEVARIFGVSELPGSLLFSSCLSGYRSLFLAQTGVLITKDMTPERPNAGTHYTIFM